jgi:hypothetical protein
MASGFWKIEDETFIVALTSVHGRNYTLLASRPRATALPVDGWDWSDDLEVTASELGFIWEAKQ